MKTSSKKIILIVIIMSIALAILLVLNQDNLNESVSIYEDKKVEIYKNEFIRLYSFNEIKKLETHKLEAYLNESGKEPEKQKYTGVLIKDILLDANIDVKDIKAILVTAVDGYTVAVDKEKVIESDNVYLVFKQNGQLLKSRDDGGVGPYQMVIVKDQFSQYWCKYVIKIEVVE